MDRRPPGPGPEVAGEFRHVVLTQGVQAPQERGFTDVAFVKRQPGEADAVGEGPAYLAQGHLVLGPVDHLVGDAGGVGDRLDALALKVRQLALDVGVEVAAGRDPAEKVVERLEVVGQGGSNESSEPL